MAHLPATASAPKQQQANAGTLFTASAFSAFSPPSLPAVPDGAPPLTMLDADQMYASHIAAFHFCILKLFKKISLIDRLNVYIYDYMMKRQWRSTALAFARDAHLPDGPGGADVAADASDADLFESLMDSVTVPIDTADGFLHEWARFVVRVSSNWTRSGMSFGICIRHARRDLRQSLQNYPIT
jgi:hypothetical protein